MREAWPRFGDGALLSKGADGWCMPRCVANPLIRLCIDKPKKRNGKREKGKKEKWVNIIKITVSTTISKFSR